MRFNNKNIKKIIKKHKYIFDSLEHYDKTNEKLWERKRIDITLNIKIIKKLKELSVRTGKPVSRIIEGPVSKIDN